MSALRYLCYYTNLYANTVSMAANEKTWGTKKSSSLVTRTNTLTNRQTDRQTNILADWLNSLKLESWHTRMRNVYLNATSSTCPSSLLPQRSSFLPQLIHSIPAAAPRTRVSCADCVRTVNLLIEPVNRECWRGREGEGEMGRQGGREAEKGVKIGWREGGKKEVDEGGWEGQVEILRQETRRKGQVREVT